MTKFYTVLLLFLTLVLNAQNSEGIDTNSLLELEKDYLTVADKMPVFPGCEMIMNKDDRFNCTELQFIQFLQQRIDYPKQALDMGCEGVIYVSFVINKNGLLQNIEVIRDQTQGCGLKEEALRVVNSFNQSGVKWAPAEHQGEEVNIKMVVPIKFGTADYKKNNKKKKN